MNYCWKYIKYEIRNISVRFSKGNAERTRAEIVTLEHKLKELEHNPIVLSKLFRLQKQTSVNVRRKRVIIPVKYV